MKEVLLRGGVWGVLALVLGIIGLAIALPMLALVLIGRVLARAVDTPTGLLYAAIPWVLGVILLTAVFQLAGAGLEPLAVWVPMIAVAGALARTNATASKRKNGSWRVITWVPLLLAMLTVAFLASAAVVPGAGATRGADQRIALFASSEDGASHLAIYDTVWHAGGLAYGASSRAYSAQWPYPTAYHLVAAHVRAALEHTVGTNELRGGRTDAIYATSLLVFGLLVWAWVTVTVTLARVWKAPPVVTAITAMGAVIAFVFWQPFAIFLYGYAPQVMSLALLGIAVSVACDTTRLGPALRCLLVLGAMVAACWTWYVLAPVFAIVLLVVALHERMFVQTRWKGAVLVCITAAAVAAIPIGYNLSTLNSGVITATGGGTPLQQGIMIAPLIVSIGLLIAMTPVDVAQRRARRVAISTGVAALIAAYGLGAYQQHVIGTTAYFFEKSLYTIIILGIALIAAVTAAIIGRVEARLIPMIVASIVMVYGGLASTYARPQKRSTATAWVYRDSGGSRRRVVFDKWIENREMLYGRFVLAWGLTNNPTNDYGTSRWLNALNGHSEETIFTFLRRVVFKQDINDLAQFIDAQDGNVAIVTADPNLEVELANSSVSSMALDHVRVIR